MRGLRWGRSASSLVRPRSRLVALSQLTINPGVKSGPRADRLRAPQPAMSAHRRITRSTKDQVVRLYERGIDSLNVAKQVGVAKSTVLRVLHERGVNVRPRGVKYKR